MKIIKRLFCCHRWEEGRPLRRFGDKLDYVIGVPWTCFDCGKTKRLPFNEPPAQMVFPPSRNP